MNSTSRRARSAAIALVYSIIVAGCSSSSPIEPIAESVGIAGTATAFAVSPLTIDFGSTQTTAASVKLTNSGSKSLSWTASKSAGWLKLNATSGTIAANSSTTLKMKVDRTGSSAGSYSTDVAISAGSAGSGTVSVTMTVPSSTTTTLAASPLTMDFGSTQTTAESVTLTNSGSTSLSWTASKSVSWLKLNATSGTIAANSSTTLKMKVDRTGRSAGTYSTEVAISAGSAGSGTVSVTMTVPSSTTTTFAASPLTIDFGSTQTTAESVTLTNSGSTSLSWTASKSVSWLNLNATSGTIAANSSATLKMKVDRSGRSPGTYSTDVAISAGTAGSATVKATMTVPTTSDPPSGDVMLAGQLVSQFSGNGLAGLTVQYNGKSTTTDANGRFTLSGSATSSPQQLTLSGAGVYRRITFAKTGDNRWPVVPASFNMAAFNDIAREDFGTSTIRWTSAPTVYIDSRPKGFTSSELSTWITETKVQAAEFISDWTGTTISPASIVVTSNPPADLSAGAIVIHFSENDSDYGGSSGAIGYARLSYRSDGSISGSAVWLRYLRYSGSTKASKRRGILGHELGHAMGFGHMTTGTESLMEPSIGSHTDLIAFDHQAASFLYTRSPRNTSPDTDSSSSFLGLLVPSRTTAAREWVCDAGGPLTEVSR